MLTVALASRFAAQSLSVLDVAPVLTSAVFDTDENDLTMFFDKPLQDVFCSPNAFHLHYDGNIWNGTGMVDISVNTVKVGMISAAPEVKPDSVEYNAGVGTLIGVNTFEVASFDDLLLIDYPVPVDIQYLSFSDTLTIRFSEDIFINTATVADFFAVSPPNELNIISMLVTAGRILSITTSVGGPGDGFDRVGFNGKINGIEDASGNDVPAFTIGMEVF